MNSDLIVGLLGIAAIVFCVPYGWLSIRVKRLQIEYLELQCEKLESDLDCHPIGTKKAASR